MTENVVATSEQDNRVSFELVNEAARTWKVLGCLDPQSLEYKNPPTPLTKDAVVRMEEGKFPLTDYRDNYRHGSNGIYIFVLTNESRISGVLDGFTYNCSPPGFGTGGTQVISVKIQSGLSTPPSVAEAP
jgi:hypothetical protein